AGWVVAVVVLTSTADDGLVFAASELSSLSLLMLRRIKNPTTTATTAMTIEIVEPIGAPPPLDFAGGRRDGWSLVMRVSPVARRRPEPGPRGGPDVADHADGAGGEPPSGRMRELPEPRSAD